MSGSYIMLDSTTLDLTMLGSYNTLGSTMPGSYNLSGPTTLGSYLGLLVQRARLDRAGVEHAGLTTLDSYLGSFPCKGRAKMTDMDPDRSTVPGLTVAPH